MIKQSIPLRQQCFSCVPQQKEPHLVCCGPDDSIPYNIENDKCQASRLEEILIMKPVFNQYCGYTGLASNQALPLSYLYMLLVPATSTRRLHTYYTTLHFLRFNSALKFNHFCFTKNALKLLTAK